MSTISLISSHHAAFYYYNKYPRETSFRYRKDTSGLLIWKTPVQDWAVQVIRCLSGDTGGQEWQNTCGGWITWGAEKQRKKGSAQLSLYNQAFHENGLQMPRSQ